MQCDVVLKVKN